MCGIAGFINNFDTTAGKAVLKKMTDALAHRGPDGEGAWVNENGSVGLGHRRLSIIDLSDCGAQPMHVNNRYVIIFNGEIYNYIELKERLLKKGYTFKSSSDTEVLALMYDAYKENCLQYFDGMFAFVIYDKDDNKVFGARDRFGEKPFFYHIDKNKTLYFASEIKALWRTGIPKIPDTTFLFNYLAFGYLQAPDDPQKTFYQNIFKLPAAHFFSYDAATATLVFSRYWNIDLNNTNTSITEAEAAAKLDALLVASIQRRLRSDVPIGSSLSGGLDSSVIVSLLDKIDAAGHIKRKTFSASFPGFAKDETAYQKIVIDATSVEPFFVYPDEASFAKNFNDIVYHQDEPFSSASINIQYEVFKKAKEQNTTVLLDGQGADEIFAGYHGYYFAYFDELRKQGNGQMKSEYELYKKLHADNKINSSIDVGKSQLFKNLMPARLKDSIRKRYFKLPVAKKIFSTAFYDRYRNSFFEPKENFSTLNEALYYSVFKQGLEELLRYADRNSMAHSREVRLPFLNHELVAFVFSLPAHFKMRAGWTKWILRQTYTNLMDERITWRKDKIGYEPPQKKWLADAAFQQQIKGCTQKLLDHHILSPDITANSVVSNSALAWKIIMAGNFMA